MGMLDSTTAHLNGVVEELWLTWRCGNHVDFHGICLVGVEGVKGVGRRRDRKLAPMTARSR
jgi:hypothetical protein